MLWARLLGFVTGTVNQELLLRNEYLAAENRILRNQIRGRLLLSDGEKATLAEIAQRLGRKALEDVAATAKPSYLDGHSALSRASFRQSGGKGLLSDTTLIPDKVLSIYLCDVRPASRGIASRRMGLWGPRLSIIGSNRPDLQSNRRQPDLIQACRVHFLVVCHSLRMIHNKHFNWSCLLIRRDQFETKLLLNCRED